MGKHTPGPWAYSGYCEADYSYHVGPEAAGKKTGIRITKNSCIENLVADVWADVEGGEKTALANARLISAAPDLLEACKQAKKYLEPDLVEPGRTVFWNLVAAIAKAEEVQS